ncbi:hypothetical protein, partial [Tepidimonas thermarum]|uniref:hypothetical protein n=1 Tax=Tepidimonas thermarum TaxID=335431 RepID=UPI00117DEF29
MGKPAEQPSQATMGLAPELESLLEHLTDFAERLREEQRARAREVFDAFMSGKEEVDVNDQSDTASYAAMEWGERMDKAIKNCLDRRSISALVEMIAEHHTNRPLKKYPSNAPVTLLSKKRAAQTWLRSDCDVHFGRFAGRFA